jgi:hypothetical protein
MNPLAILQIRTYLHRNHITKPDPLSLTSQSYSS